MPKVSVIVPVYGVEKYIERCATSLFEQTLDCIEYIFIDDCTPDKSIDILKKVIANYATRLHDMNYIVKIVQMQTNSGQAAVRARGVKECTGDFIIHCDSDDWVDKDIYRKLYSAAVSENAELVLCDFYAADSNHNRNAIKACHTTNVDDFTISMMFNRDPWSLWNKLFKKTCYNEIVMPKGNMGEDMTMVLQLIRNVKRMKYINTPLYYYFNNSLSMMNNITEKKALTNFYGIKKNTDIILNIYGNCKDKRIKDGLVFLKYNVKSFLFPILKTKKEYKKIFNETYTDINSKVFTIRKMPKRYMIAYYMALIGLYPLHIKHLNLLNT